MKEAAGRRRRRRPWVSRGQWYKKGAGRKGRGRKERGHWREEIYVDKMEHDLTTAGLTRLENLHRRFIIRPGGDDHSSPPGLFGTGGHRLSPSVWFKPVVMSRL